jgi:Calreticulin family
MKLSFKVGAVFSLELLKSCMLNPYATDGLECGGAYLKLLRENKALHLEEFSNASPYVIMFGPDKCGSANKVCTVPADQNYEHC